MKRVIILNILLLTFVATINSQNDCDISLQEAQKAYNEKNYPLTKILCNHIISNCGENYGNVQEILQEIEEANNEPFLTLSNKDIFINGDGGDTTINVICNRDWTLILDNSDMFFSVLKKDKCVKIRVEENDGENIKHGYIDIQTIDGTISKRINIYQFSKSNNNTKVEIPYLFINKSKIYNSAAGSREYIKVTTNSEWDVQVEPYMPFSLTKQNDTLIVDIFKNNSNLSHTEHFFIRTTDNSVIKKVTIIQSGNTSYDETEFNNEQYERQESTNSFQNKEKTRINTEPTLYVDKTSIYTNYDATTEYVIVQSNSFWEIVNKPNSFFSTTINKDTIFIYIDKNYSSNFSRTGSFTIQTVDGKKSTEITITQPAQPSTTYHSIDKNTNDETYSYYKKETRTSRYLENTGIKEMTWFGLSLYSGFNIGFHASVLNLRYKLVEIQPINLGLISTIDYLGEIEFFYYQPVFRVYIPTHRRGSIYADLGAILCFDGTQYTATFLKAELGFRFVPENRYAPTWDFFLRYNGGFCVGATLVLSTRFD